MDDVLAPARLAAIGAAILGAIVGSFLNVVVYRLPRGLSVTRPNWSFCPSCRSTIKAYDNVPILSWLCLRRRCRHCRAVIPTIYPLIECTTMLLFVSVWDAIFAAKIVPGAGQLSADWPVALGYLVLFAGLLAGAAMDIESYIIDIRICLFTIIVGVVCHGLRWTMPGQAGAPQPFSAITTLPPSLCLTAIAMAAAWLLTYLLARCVCRGGGDLAAEPPNEDSPAAAAEEPQPPARSGAALPEAGRFSHPAAIVAFSCATLGLLYWQVAAQSWGLVGRLPPGGQRGFAACFLCMMVLLAASMVQRASDSRIIAEIEAERAGARRMALQELAWFVPSIVVGIALLILFRREGQAADGWTETIRALAGGNRLGFGAAGAVQALAAAVLGAGLGWTVRILGTLAFGKEAFGTGDIYIMAAIAAVAGLPLLIFAFFLAAILALVGVLACVFHKSSRAIPFGPWLALGALVSLWLQPSLLAIFRPAAAVLWALLSGQPLSWTRPG